jgi:hypothetical protein
MSPGQAIPYYDNPIGDTSSQANSKSLREEESHKEITNGSLCEDESQQELTNGESNYSSEKPLRTIVLKQLLHRLNHGTYDEVDIASIITDDRIDYLI